MPEYKKLYEMTQQVKLINKDTISYSDLFFNNFLLLYCYNTGLFELWKSLKRFLNFSLEIFL